MSQPAIIGIEGTAHTCGVGIVTLCDEVEILANQKKTFTPVTGGIHPREAAYHITENLPFLLRSAFEEANIDQKNVCAVSFSQGPGLGPCLRATATGARALSLALKKPLIGVNHPLAHIEMGMQLEKLQDPLTLYVSGGNTQLTAYSNHRYHVFGETQDIAIGNMIDTVARAIGYDYALAGPIVEKEAHLGNKLINLPYSVKGMALSYSGFATAAIRAFEEYHEKTTDICYSLQEIGFAMLAEITEKSLIVSGRKELLLTGGVAANQRLRDMLQIIAEENNCSFSVVDRALAGDNGVMIAVTGKKYFQKNQFTALKDSNVIPKWRIDEVYVPW